MGTYLKVTNFWEESDKQKESMNMKKKKITKSLRHYLNSMSESNLLEERVLIENKLRNLKYKIHMTPAPNLSTKTGMINYLTTIYSHLYFLKQIEWD